MTSLLHGQISEGPARKYMRPTWTVMTAPADNSLEQAILDNFEGLGVPNKFDAHGIPMKKLQFITSLENKARDLAVQQAIAPHTAEVVGRWFDRDSAGTMSSKVILERGTYSETDLDRIINLLSTVDRTGQQGWQLLDHTFIAVYDVISVMKTTETKSGKALNALSAIGNAQAAANGGKNTQKQQKAQEIEGWKAKYRADLYRLDWTDSVEFQFAQQLWNDRKNPEPTKADSWAGRTFPVKKVYSYTGEVKNTRLKTENQPPLETLLPECASKIQGKAIKNFSKHVADLRPKAGIVSDYPLHAKLGTKESVYTNARYLAYKFKSNDKNGTRMKRMGVVRAYNVVRNEQAADGRSTSSVFQQQGGRTLQLGYVIEERHDLGMNIAGGWVLADAISTGPELTYKSNILGTLTKFPNFYVGMRFAVPTATGLDASGLIMPRALENANTIKPGAWSGNGFQWGFTFSKEFYPGKRGNVYLEPTIAYSWLTFSLNKNGDTTVNPTDFGLNEKALSYKAGMFSMSCGIAHHFGPVALELRPMIGIRGKFKYNVDKDDDSPLETAAVTGNFSELSADAESVANLFGKTNLTPSIMVGLKVRF
ncbi:MAG TPA: hypothetical protein PL070_02025 [Flavobacteriales bacterium]|nr:hypothetical protein [Flavobacteriales bacterium]